MTYNTYEDLAGIHKCQESKIYSTFYLFNSFEDFSFTWSVFSFLSAIVEFFTEFLKTEEDEKNDEIEWT